MIGKEIKKARESRNMTQLDLAKILNYSSAQFVHLIEIEKSKVPLKLIGTLNKIFGPGFPVAKIKKHLLDQYSKKIDAEILKGRGDLE